MNELIRIEKVCKSRKVKTDDGGERTIEVLTDFSLSVNAGEIVTILGPSGVGKSTLLRLLNGLDSPDSGKIFLEGVHISAIDPPTLRRKVGMVFQAPAFVADTVRENLCYGPRLARKTPEDSDGVFAQLLEMVQLDASFLPRNPDALSQGEKQRVSIAMALSNQPAILLMDEPTSALDAATAAGIIDLVLGLNRKLGLTLIMVTHVSEHADRLQGARRIVL